jgi:hypothetical protein
MGKRQKVPVPSRDAEKESLRQLVCQLEEERARDRRSLAALEAECKAYRRLLASWAWSQVSDLELQRWAEEEEEGIPLEEFIDELEYLAKGSSPCQPARGRSTPSVIRKRSEKR